MHPNSPPKRVLYDVYSSTYKGGRVPLSRTLTTDSQTACLAVRQSSSLSPAAVLWAVPVKP
jgi:hypothetical protein